jgi:tripartite-type tricarboxylate transporter receptor subunit TctC
MMHRILRLGLIVMALALASAALAQGYPLKPVRLITEFVPGSSGDVNLRSIVERWSPLVGQAIIIENRPGAGGVVAAQQVVPAAPDGYTLLGATANVPVTRVHLAKNNPINVERDLTPITQLTETTAALIANPAFPANNLTEFLDYTRRNPGKVSYASSGVGSTHHLSGEQIKMLTGIDMVHVPYKALQLAVQDVVSGQIPVSFSTSGEAISQVKAGKVKVIAVVNLVRFPAWPEVGTVAETLAEFEPPPLWVALYGPGAMPRQLVLRIHSDVARVLAEQGVRDKLGALGTRAVGNSPDELAELMKRQTAAIGRVVRAANIQPID